MQTTTTKITLPKTGIEAEIKDWITGEEAEYIDDAILQAVKIRPDLKTKGASTENFDIKSLTEQIHRQIEKFVVSLGEVKKDILKEALSLPEEDYNFLNEAIADKRSKKKEPNGQQGQ